MFYIYHLMQESSNYNSLVQHLMAVGVLSSLVKILFEDMALNTKLLKFWGKLWRQIYRALLVIVVVLRCVFDIGTFTILVFVLLYIYSNFVVLTIRLLDLI